MFAFLRDNTPDTAYAVYASLVAQARRPVFYADLAVPDTVDGRFDMIVMHLVLLYKRLERLDAAARAFGQHLFDIFIKDMERSLREQGVGDLSIAKQMKKVGESYYGRSAAYVGALQAADDDLLGDAIARNILAAADREHAAPRLAAYMRAADALLAEQPADALMGDRVRWPDPSALAKESGDDHPATS